MVGCAEGAGQVPHPGTLVDRLGSFVAFATALSPAEQQTTTEGDRTTVRVDRVEVLVQAEPALRRRIVDTIRQISVDANGCAVSDPISQAPGRRPHPAAPFIAGPNMITSGFSASGNKVDILAPGTG